MKARLWVKMETESAWELLTISLREDHRHGCPPTALTITGIHMAFKCTTHTHLHTITYKTPTFTHSHVCKEYMVYDCTDMIDLSGGIRGWIFGQEAQFKRRKNVSIVPNIIKSKQGKVIQADHN